MNKERIHTEILNFILYYTSDDDERENLTEVLEDYIEEVFEDE